MTTDTPRLREVYARCAKFVFDAIDSKRELNPDWHGDLNDVANVLDRIATSERADPDSRDRAREAMNLLCGLWLSSGETTEALYLDLYEGEY